MPSAIDPHSDSDSERTLTASIPDYGDSTSVRSPDATLLVGTPRTAVVVHLWEDSYGPLTNGLLRYGPLKKDYYIRANYSTNAKGKLRYLTKLFIL